MTPKTTNFAKNCLIWAIFIFAGIGFVQTTTWTVKSGYALFTAATPARFEPQVRQWASGYPADLRDRWAWCYLDSAENWSTDQKLREDVRLKSTQVLTDTERQTLIPLDDKIAEAVPKQKTPLQETYLAVGNGLKVTEWTPPPEITVSPPLDPPEPQPPIRRRIFRR